MAPLTLNHFSIRSLEIDKTVAFYSQVLDLKKRSATRLSLSGSLAI